jgi:hypothetical protein
MAHTTTATYSLNRRVQGISLFVSRIGASNDAPSTLGRTVKRRIRTRVLKEGSATI